MAAPALVTGGCGFVGRHLIKKLVTEKNTSVWVIDNLFSGRHPDTWVPTLGMTPTASVHEKVKSYARADGSVSLHFMHEDACKWFYELLQGISVFDKVLPAFGDVFHLASIVGGRAVIDGDPILVSYDLAIDALFFNWVVKNKHKLQRVMYASSSAAYPIDLQQTTKTGGEKTIALSEDMLPTSGRLGEPDMTYGWSKMTGEFLARLAAERYGVHVACIRPFSGYGEDQDLTYPVPAIALRVAKREAPLTVWGTGEQGRDFVYIDDCCDAFFVILDKVSDGSGVNIGTGAIHTFLEVAKIFAELEHETNTADGPYQPTVAPMVDKPMGVQSRYCNPSKVNSLGWTHRHSIREGFLKVLEGARERKAAGL